MFIELHSGGKRIACNKEKIVLLRDDGAGSAISVETNRKSQRRCVWLLLDESYDEVLDKIKNYD